MLYLAGAQPLDPLDFWAVKVMLLLMAALCAWLAFDTPRALKKMVRLTARWSPVGGRWLINPEKAGWIWFYRIDAALVFVGIVYMFVQHYTR